MSHVLQLPEELSFEKVGIQGRNFDSLHLTKDMQVSRIDTETGHETAIIEKESTFTYYILNGTGYFVIDGAQEDCQAGNLVVIPAGKKFIYKGNMQLLLICTPPWRQEQEEEFYES